MSPIIDDLRVEAEIPPQAHRPGTTVVVKLRFSNLGTRARTLLLNKDEVHRAGQSTFRLEIGSGPPHVQPTGGDDYEPSEADFHELGARGRAEFEQSLRLPAELQPGRYKVRWVYENEVANYPSSAGTPGKPIPGIWLGRIEDVFELQVARAVIRTEPRER